MTTIASHIDLSKPGDVIFNQNAYGTSQQSCVFDSIWGALKIQGREYHNNIDISVQFGYNDTWLSMGRTLPANTGLVAGYAYEQTLQKGLPNASTFSYGIGNEYVTPSAAVYAEAATQKITSFTSLNVNQNYSRIVYTIGEQNMHGNPVLCIGNNMKYADGSLTGPHAFLAIGIDDATQLVKIQNSIGSDWGDHGYGYIKYQDFTTAGGLNRMDVINGFKGIDLTWTPEREEVSMLYSMLHRCGEHDGVMFWADHLKAGMAPTVMMNAFVGSPEGQAIYGSMNNASFAADMYRAATGRTASAADIALFGGQLDSGVSRGQLAYNLLHWVDIGNDTQAANDRLENVETIGMNYAITKQIDGTHIEVARAAYSGVTDDANTVIAAIGHVEAMLGW